jgi:hypothetical protein
LWRWWFWYRGDKGGDMMGHFALVDDGIVRNVICIANAVMDDLPFPESEPLGQAFIATCPDLAAQAGEWLECSYNANFRGVYPGMGYSFDGTDFVAPAAL